MVCVAYWGCVECVASWGCAVSVASSGCAVCVVPWGWWVDRWCKQESEEQCQQAVSCKQGLGWSWLCAYEASPEGTWLFPEDQGNP